MRLEQFVFTRFNVLVDFAAPDYGVQEEWLAHRFNLFESFCLPSVIGQKYVKFRWILFVNPQTPAKWLKRLEADIEPVELARIVAVPYFDKQYVNAEIRKEISPSITSIIVTTRLDNDDAIASNFLADVADDAQSNETPFPFVLNYLVGCQANRHGIFLIHSRLNPFLSAVSLNSNLVTCFERLHRRMWKIGPVVDKISESPKWMQMIHSRNARNYVKHPKLRLLPDLIADFGISPQWRNNIKDL